MATVQELRAQRRDINRQIEELRAKATDLSRMIYEAEKKPVDPEAKKKRHSMAFIVKKTGS